MKYLHRIPHWALGVAASLLAVVFLVVAGYSFFESGYHGRVYPHITVAGMKVGGLPMAEAQRQIENKITAMEGGVPVTYQNKTVVLGSRSLIDNPDVSSQVAIYDPRATLTTVMNIGRGENFFDNLYEQLSALLGGAQLELVATVDKMQISQQLQQQFADSQQPAENARVIINGQGNYRIEDGHNGLGFDYDEAVNTVADHFKNGDTSAVILTAQPLAAEVTTASLTAVQDQIEKFMTLPALKLSYDKKEWRITNTVFRNWLELAKPNKEIIVTLRQQAIKEYLEKEVGPALTVESLPPRLQMTDGRVTVWQKGQDGVALDTEATIQKIKEWPQSQTPTEAVAVVTKVTVNTEVNQDAEDLGIKEIIGTGISHFSGSPNNRRHNIRTGAMALHGLLIKPNEEFSLLKALGEIDAKSGYLPELVIKENKTTPEYGGGLCQIGTTMFRATFNSGLPVTQRRNHSYRVVYYEPAGTDATIYDPAPDYRFVNDTGHYILIQARIEGDDISFDFWGTKDGRVAEATKPVIYNIVQPAPTKMIETTDLPEGEKKCTEKAHAGADAYFDYKVTYASGEIKEKRFTSHYVPWQAVCLVGAKKTNPENGTPPPATSTITPSVSPSVNP